MSFVHLHRHSEWSLLDGTGTASQYAARAVELGQSALALTDHGTLAGWLHHEVACGEAEIKPIFGMEAYFRPDRLAKMRKGERRYHLSLLAKNAEGYKNLMRLSTDAWKVGMSGPGMKRPCIDWSTLSKYREGLIVGSACASSGLCRLIEAEQVELARKWIQRMQMFFGDDFYIEIMPHDFDTQRMLNPILIEMGNEFGVPVVATVDAHYPWANWYTTQDVMLMISTGQSHALRKKKREAGEDVYTMAEARTLYLMSADECLEAFKTYHPDLTHAQIQTAINNTALIADRIERVETDRSPKMPKLKTKDSAEVILTQWCKEGLRRIGKESDLEYRRRMDYELSVLKDNDAIDYFVILGTHVRRAKEKGIRVGAGRGSAAGALVAYLIGITAIDPIAHGLLFERFMNPGRKGLPDIDVDFQHDRTAEVRQDVYDTFGHDKVVPVCAWQNFKIRSSIKEVARVFDVPFDVVNRVTKKLDDDKGTLTLVDLRKVDKELDLFARSFPEVWEHAIRIEGQTKSLSVHPAGLVITDRPAEELLPLIQAKSGDYVTAWSEGADLRISDFGFVKYDFLSTDSLTIQAATVDMIRERHGVEIDLDDMDVTRDPLAADPLVLADFASGRVGIGIFQFTRAMSHLAKQIKPDSFNDLVAIISLGRPGPMQAGFPAMYARRKAGIDPVTYLDPALEPVLKETYGLMVYQEQVMAAVQAYAGFSLAEADDIRRGMGKKDIAKLKAYKDEFIKRAVAQGRMKAEAIFVWDQIEGFSGYGFNKSHAAGYAVQGYQDAWLKRYYPLEFYCMLASYERDKVAAVIREARSRGIEILSPDINRSGSLFTIEGDALRMGLLTIKNVGEGAILEIEEKRPFKDWDDFNDRVVRKHVRSNVKKSLVDAGAMDEWLMRYWWEPDDKRQAELDVMSVAFSGSDEFVNRAEMLERRVDTEADFDDMQDGAEVSVAGEIIGVKRILTKKQQPMGFLDIVFGEDSFSVTVFTKLWEMHESVFKEGQVLLIQGRKDAGRDCIIANYICTFEDWVRVLERQGITE